MIKKIIKIHRFQEKGDYVVVGRGVPRSVGLNKACANLYSKWYKEKGKKPRIIRIK